MQKIQKYYNTDKVSQSSLKDLAYHPGYYKAKYIDKTISEEYGDDADHFIIGSAAECLLLTPEFWEQMYSIRSFELSPQLRKLADYLIKNKTNYSNITSLFELGKSLNLFGQIKNFSTFETLLEKENFLENLNFYKNSVNKTVITEEQYKKAVQIVNSFSTSIFTKQYFIKTEHVEILTSLPIYWFYKKVPCKSLIDFVRINHLTKSISINDLKTTRFETKNFKSSILQYRYDIQGAFYLDAFKWWVENIRTDLKDYEIIGFSFFVESTKNIGSPLIFHLTLNDVHIGKYGGEICNNNGLKINIEGFDKLIDDLLWHQETQIWSYTKDQYENKGIIEVNIGQC